MWFGFQIVNRPPHRVENFNHFVSSLWNTLLFRQSVNEIFCLSWDTPSSCRGRRRKGGIYGIWRFCSKACVPPAAAVVAAGEGTGRPSGSEISILGEGCPLTVGFSRRSPVSGAFHGGRGCNIDGFTVESITGVNWPCFCSERGALPADEVCLHVCPPASHGAPHGSEAGAQ